MSHHEHGIVSGNQILGLLTKHRDQKQAFAVFVCSSQAAVQAALGAAAVGINCSEQPVIITLKRDEFDESGDDLKSLADAVHNKSEELKISVILNADINSDSLQQFEQNPDNVLFSFVSVDVSTTDDLDNLLRQLPNLEINISIEIRIKDIENLKLLNSLSELQRKNCWVTVDLEDQTIESVDEHLKSLHKTGLKNFFITVDLNPAAPIEVLSSFVGIGVVQFRIDNSAQLADYLIKDQSLTSQGNFVDKKAESIRKLKMAEGFLKKEAELGIKLVGEANEGVEKKPSESQEAPKAETEETTDIPLIDDSSDSESDSESSDNENSNSYNENGSSNSSEDEKEPTAEIKIDEASNPDSSIDDGKAADTEKVVNLKPDDIDSNNEKQDKKEIKAAIEVENIAEENDKNVKPETEKQPIQDQNVEPSNPPQDVEKVESPKPPEKVELPKSLEKVESQKPAEKVESPKVAEKSESPKAVESVEPPKLVEKVDPPKPVEKVESPKTAEEVEQLSSSSGSTTPPSSDGTSDAPQVKKFAGIKPITGLRYKNQSQPPSGTTSPALEVQKPATKLWERPQFTPFSPTTKKVDDVTTTDGNSMSSGKIFTPTPAASPLTRSVWESPKPPVPPKPPSSFETFSKRDLSQPQLMSFSTAKESGPQIPKGFESFRQTQPSGRYQRPDLGFSMPTSSSSLLSGRASFSNDQTKLVFESSGKPWDAGQLFKATATPQSGPVLLQCVQLLKVFSGSSFQGGMLLQGCKGCSKGCLRCGHKQLISKGQQLCQPKPGGGVTLKPKIWTFKSRQ